MFCVSWLSVSCVSFKRLMAKNTMADYCQSCFTAVVFAGATCECVCVAGVAVAVVVAVIAAVAVAVVVA